MRYAVYATPARYSGLADAGAAWLGRDAFSGEALPQPAVPGVDPDRFVAITADARRYGFHATLKPPFSLAADRDEGDLRAAFADFAKDRAAPRAVLSVGRIGGFLAIVPQGRPPGLHALADAAVEAFDRFRAAAAPADIARRRTADLTGRQDMHLLRWGYPYVFDDFRFHLTLSARLAGAEARFVEAAANAWFAPCLAEPVAVDTLGLFVEPSPGAPFTVLETATLAPAGAETR
jgi:putative phosphonate metabolism protein